MVDVCSSCPFLIDNYGKRVPKGWYSEANVKRLWRGVSQGERLACAEQERVGRAARECAGALHLVVRHLEAAKTPTYTRRAATPLSALGFARWRGRLVSYGASADALSHFAHGTSEALGVPWDCAVTNVEGAAREPADEDPAN